MAHFPVTLKWRRYFPVSLSRFAAVIMHAIIPGQHKWNRSQQFEAEPFKNKIENRALLAKFDHENLSHITYTSKFSQQIYTDLKNGLWSLWTGGNLPIGGKVPSLCEPTILWDSDLKHEKKKIPKLALWLTRLKCPSQFTHRFLFLQVITKLSWASSDRFCVCHPRDTDVDEHWIVLGWKQGEKKEEKSIKPRVKREWSHT